MATKEYKVIWVNPINVVLVKRQPEEVFTAEVSQELNNLVSHNYLLVIEQPKTETLKQRKKKEIVQ